MSPDPVYRPGVSPYSCGECSFTDFHKKFINNTRGSWAPVCLQASLRGGPVTLSGGPALASSLGASATYGSATPSGGWSNENQIFGSAFIVGLAYTFDDKIGGEGSDRFVPSLGVGPFKAGGGYAHYGSFTWTW